MSPRRPSPLGGRRPTREELSQFENAGIDDVLGDSARLLIVGINPGLWTAAVNAPFAHPGNRFWPSLEAAGIMPHRVDASRGLSEEDARLFVGRGLGLTNLVNRATARASELSTAELVKGRRHLENVARAVQPKVIAVLGITAYRAAFDDKKAALGKQDITIEGAQVWALPQPSGLNAHAPLPVLAEWWRTVAEIAL
ncbi:mismatch-specific DNA-glycosylase [Corynebacterium tapiri]|uniref:Mismatch-specific DNA-glycosylase n=1 Tax=Corynebacterium tapiri TaxID=1448266 RepID=A0A5C4U6A7_9CORY|nr:mismatch-specific DNA-glycosylase [Corynebacterium tapiri]